MQKIPQAVAMLLLMSAMACPTCSAQVTPSAKGAPRGMTATRGVSEVEALLTEFLSKVDDPKMHERFWADDLVYVGAKGAKRTKQEILASMKEEEAAKEDPAKGQPSSGESYTAEEVKVRQYGEVCVLNFRLARHTPDGKTSYYRNSGTFVNNGGQWQAVSWQATAEPEGALPSEAPKPDGKK